MAFVRHTIDINGCKLSFARAGTGLPLLYLHGTDGLAEWPAILDTLAERFDVIVPDHPGFGASEAPAWIDEVSDVAYCYLDAIEALGLSSAHVVGQSLGGWIALEMAVRSTHRLRSLTLISAAGIHVKGVPKADIFMIDPEEQARLAYADPKLGAEAAERAGADKYHDLAILNRIASARFGWQPRFFNPRLERWLHRVNVPTQIIWGEGDRIIPPAYAEAFHRLIPGSTLTMIPNAGHLPHVERTPAVTQAMQTFLRH
jgi:pimeloyl-ACP methyl ester carboxylesterase